LTGVQKLETSAGEKPQGHDDLVRAWMKQKGTRDQPMPKRDRPMAGTLGQRNAAHDAEGKQTSREAPD
jgi:hypothetical protein